MHAEQFIPAVEGSLLPPVESVEEQSRSLLNQALQLEARRQMPRDLDTAFDEELALHNAQLAYLDLMIPLLEEKKQQGTISDKEHADLATMQWGRDELIARQEHPKFKERLLPKIAVTMAQKFREQQLKEDPYGAGYYRYMSGDPIPQQHIAGDMSMSDLPKTGPMNMALPKLREMSGTKHARPGKGTIVGRGGDKFAQRIAEFQKRKAEISRESEAKETVNVSGQSYDDIADLKDEDIEPVPLPPGVEEFLAQQKKENAAAVIANTPTEVSPPPDVNQSGNTIIELEEHRDTQPDEKRQRGVGG